MLNENIILAGGAGLVGQNLIVRLKARGYRKLVVLDKHRANLAILKKLHPDVHSEYADLARPGEWQQHLASADVVVMLQAQIGGKRFDEFQHNNIDATRLILEALPASSPPYLVHISSSVVESVADDFYTRSKREQEEIVLASGLACTILRPTLMYGWFDRKHLGWLSRFMQKLPVFPIPGSGRYMRQPLYVGDFCNIIISCIEQRHPGGIFNISGQEKVDYIDIIRTIRRVTHARTLIVPIPYWFFYGLLALWALFDKTPPFTTQQLRALCADDEFELIDWPDMFGVQSTPFEQAIDETFNDPCYSKVVLEF